MIFDIMSPVMVFIAVIVGLLRYHDWALQGLALSILLALWSIKEEMEDK